MINIDYKTLHKFFDENIDFFIGARLQKIQQPTRRDFIFSLRNNGESRKLYININPQVYHIAFINESSEKKRNLVIPKQPPMFCMLLRKYLEGCKIFDAVAIENERILEFHFETIDEFSQKRSLCLCIELMGKHSNVILYDRETSVIIGCAHNVGTEKSRYRELQGGLKYIYPPKLVNRSHSDVNSEQECKSFKILYKMLEAENPVNTSINTMIDKYYSNIQHKMIMDAKKSHLCEVVYPKIRRVNNSIEKITKLLNRRNKADEYKHYGELLTANLWQKVDSSSAIEVFDYINNCNVVIELDETISMNENAQRYFKLYSKSKSTKEKSEKLLNELRIEKEYFDTLLFSINSVENISDFEEIEFELGLLENKPKKQEKSEILKLIIKGFEIYIGKNNKQNDYIVSKIAKDEDIWFHTRLCAGSHVLLKTNGIEPDEEVLFECCKLARQYSSATQPSKVGVIYTKAKYLRKPPAAPLGYVTYKNEHEVLV